MFNFNGYNPFHKLINAIASEIATPTFKNWVHCKAQHDIQLVITGIESFIDFGEYCLNQGKVAANLVGIEADKIEISGLGSAVYKAGRYAFESGAMFRCQCFEGFQNINPNAKALPAIALPPAQDLELQPPTLIFPQPKAIAPGVTASVAMSFKDYVLMLLGWETIEAIASGVTKKQLIKAIRQGGGSVSDRTRKGDVLRLMAG